jgi:hypothetical protein
MKFYNLILIILIVFIKTGNVLSDTNIFDVNNIEIEKEDQTTNDILADRAIKKGFKKLLDNILLAKDIDKIKSLQFTEIKDLVTYYQVSSKIDGISNNKIIYNISFNKDKIHRLFYTNNISYSEISDKELFILPILKKNNQIYIYNKNFFYKKWNEIYNTELIDFILPLENIEIIQNVNTFQNSLLNLDLKKIFHEYSDKNLAIVLIEDTDSVEEKVYFKIKISGKDIIKNIKIKRLNSNKDRYNEIIITKVKEEIINLIKSQNLIDVQTPSYINVSFKITSQTNLFELNKRIRNIDLITNINIREFNNEFVFLKIKYLGKLDQIIRLLESQKIILEYKNEKWNLNIV